MPSNRSHITVTRMTEPAGSHEAQQTPNSLELAMNPTQAIVSSLRLSWALHLLSLLPKVSAKLLNTA